MEKSWLYSACKRLRDFTDMGNISVYTYIHIYVHIMYFYCGARGLELDS